MRKDTRNKTNRPAAGTINRRIWDISDECYLNGFKKLRKEVLAKCKDEGIHHATASVEHCEWRRYMGLTKKLIDTRRI